MIQRELAEYLRQAALTMPVVSITGPRQSGKTTLARAIFADYQYVTLEDPDRRQFAQEDPRHFLASYGSRLIIDEAQYAPQLFSYIQVAVDESRRNGEYILTGSQHFLMIEKISQSLAGRVAIFNLLPFGYDELVGGNSAPLNIETAVFQGSYPRIYDQKTPPSLFYSSYLQTYLERDVRQIINIGNLSAFQTFMKSCAGMTGQMLNLSTLAVELGISVPTAKSWLSVLEASFAVFILRPYYRNFQKRLVKTPKLYFYDTGLACYLLGIQSPEQYDNYFQKGALFENWVISELAKKRFHRGQRPEMYFWQDKSMREIDCILEENTLVKAVEIKAGKTLKSEFFKNLTFFQEEGGTTAEHSTLLYAGDERQVRPQGRVLNWRNVGDI